jgi:hypothetical protein
MIRTILRLLPLLILIATCILLLQESPLLTLPLLEGSDIPGGTIIAWLFLITLPLSILLGIRYIRKPTSVVYRFYRRAFSLYTILGLGWGILTYLLSGNWSYTFSSEMIFKGSEAAFNMFLAYTVFTVLLSVLTFIIFLIHHLIIKLKQKP